MPESKPLTPQQAKTYARLKEIRESQTCELRPTALLRDTIVGLDGKEAPFRLRYYQVQGVFHMLTIPRMILGDDCGLGKTAETIATLCYLWQKEPNNRVIVVAPKSAIRQWAAEIRRFTNGVKVFIASDEDKAKGESPVEARKRVYEAWANAPADEFSILILNYAILVRDWHHGGFQPPKKSGKLPKEPVKPGLLDGLTNRPGLVVVYDECFDYFTPVTLADGSTELIGKIVCGQRQVEVLTWNWEKQCLEPRRVTRWIRNPLKGGPNGQGRREGLLKLTFKYARSCRVTKSHKFYKRDGGSVRARDLQEGSETTFLNPLAPSTDQLQVILGGLLGDASISHPRRPLWGVSFVQGAAQLRYLNFKREVLRTLGVSEVSTSPSGYGGQDIHRFRLKGNSSLCSRFQVHDGWRKKLTLEWLDAITPLGLAIWYGDDGSLQEHLCKDGQISRTVILNTQGFTLDEHQLLAGWLLWRWGVRAEVKETPKGFLLYLPRESAERFLELLPGALPGVEHKFPGKSLLEASNLACQPNTELVADEVISARPWKRSPKQRDCQEYVYDLEVEGNHNYFAGGSLVSNCTAFKNSSTKTWEIAGFLSERAHRCYGLTATLLKNHLMEGYCIFRVIRPGVFTTKTKFLEDYCHVIQQQVGKARINLVTGYKNIDHFRERIDPFYLGRKKHQVATELPKLTTREIAFRLNPAEEVKYMQALNGVLELGDGELREFEENKALVSLIYCQQVVNSLALLQFKEGDFIDDFSALAQKTHKVGALGTKEQALVDLVTGELDDQKVIVYTRFESLVGRLQAILKREGIESVRITGREKDHQRKAAQDAFQDLESKVKVCFITAAGSEAINLQAAIAMVFYDAPWSWGDFVQTIGRMIRIGSPHAAVLAFHLVAERGGNRDDRKTIDHHVLQLLRKKKNMIDQVLGDGAVGALKFDKSGSPIKELLKMMQGKAA